MYKQALHREKAEALTGLDAARSARADYGLEIERLTELRRQETLAAIRSARALGYTFGEIGAELGMTKQTVQSLLRRFPDA